MRILRTMLTAAFAAVLAMTLAVVPATAAPPNELITVPAVQQWDPAGKHSFTWRGQQIVVEPGNAELTEVAHTFAEDLEAATGDMPSVVEGTEGRPGAIVLRLGDQGHGPESYALGIGKHSLEITGTTAHGAFNGTRTVLQLLRQDQSIPAGTVTDWPDKEVRSVLMDNTPRHFSLDWWENFFRSMSYLKLNDTNLYLDGVGLDVEEMKAIDELGQKYYVEVVPQINMPSHMHVLLPAHPEYQLVNQDGSLNPTALDLTNPEAVDWALGLIEERISVFSSDEWHLGSDEFPGWPGTGENHPQLDAYAKERFGPDATFADLFADFQNRANDLVKEHGKTMRVWNDMIRETSVVQLDDDVTVEYWIQHDGLPGLLSGKDIADRGNPLINAHIDHLYYDQSRRNLDPRDVYEKFDPDVIHHETPVPSESVRGARLPVWLAWINTPMESDAEVLDNIRPSMAAFAQVTWGSEKPVETWSQFRSIVETVGEAPGQLPESNNSIQPGPAAAQNADGTVAYFARDAQGNLWTGKQSAPATTHFDQTLVSEGIDGDPVVTTLEDGRLQVAARTTRGTLMVATQSAPNSQEFDAEQFKVRVDTDPALVAGTAVVNNNGKLEAVDTTDGTTQRITQNATGEPAAVVLDGTLHVATATKHGVVAAQRTDQGWDVVQDRSRKLASDPDLVTVSGAPTVIGIDQAGVLAAATLADGALTWADVVDGATGQQQSAQGTDGVPHVAVRTEDGRLIHARSDGTWTPGEVTGGVIEDPSLGLNEANEPFIFTKIDNGMQLAAVPDGDGYATSTIAESTVGPAAVTMDSQDRPIYFVATTYGDLQTGTKWGTLWEWGRDFAIGTMAYPDDDLSPENFEQVLLEDGFETDTSGRYTTLDTSPGEVAPEPVIGGGALAVGAEEPFYSTISSDVPVAAGDTVVIAEVDAWLEGDRTQDTLMVGFARDEKNYSMMWVGNRDNRVGFDTVSDGRLMPDGANGTVPVVVEPGDRIAVVLTGKWMVGYVERDGVWHRVHTSVTTGDDDMADPEVRSQYRYAVALRGDEGELRIGHMKAAARG